MQKARIGDWVLETSAQARELHKLLATNDFEGNVKFSPGLMGGTVVTFECGDYCFFLTNERKRGCVPVKIGGSLWRVMPEYTTSDGRKCTL